MHKLEVQGAGAHELAPASSLLDRWNEIDKRDPLPSINDICKTIGIDPPISKPGDRFERDQVDIAMYWPKVL